MYIASNGVKTAVILHDEFASSPRDPDYQDNLATMTCWHRRYNLGDDHSFSSPRDFLVDLAEKNVSYPEFFRFVQDGGIEGLRLTEVHRDETSRGSYGQQCVLQCRDDDGSWVSTGCLVSEELERISGPELLEDSLLDYLDRFELQDLLNSSNNVAVMPLHLYDHSGLSISTGSFIGRALHAEWDSGQVGYIHMTKDTAVGNLAMPTDTGLKPLNDENWKARAEDYMKAEVREYDNYLRGMVYGYRTFEGREEVDACWGFNPGDGNIEDLMKEELGAWFGPGLEFEYSYDLAFDIDDYFDSHSFPELRERIKSEVLDGLSAAESDSRPYPFEMSADAIRENVDGVLSNIVSEIYEEHVEPTPDRVREALDENAGVSREVKPKLSISDLTPDRDYTLEELAELARQKAAEKNPHRQHGPREHKPPELGL